ncbi:hypothetical protein D3879_09690 [Pseudomonas cavernicola]|uniref:Uncharacterized protein n=1 Tax=Pseudomonas cavernicola TaxID=2320866 RepID=A0A418XLZ1_9PSED|nr:hypothetical protein [Pseudomonas cavernicola]RJG13492.1 hypothetical protein D3879_09690 [Pseudomonas cavernicola]
MFFIKPRFAKPISIALLAAAMAACSTNTPTPATTTSKPASSKAVDVALDNTDWYQVRTESELYLFDSYAVFNQFLQTGKAPYTKPLGKKDNFDRNIVLALAAEDQSKDLNAIAASRLWNVSIAPAYPFYGEIREEQVIYVFSRYGDMVDMAKIGEPTFSYVDVGGGPKGERVVYVLAKEEKKPEKAIQAFNAKYK